MKRENVGVHVARFVRHTNRSISFCRSEAESVKLRSAFRVCYALVLAVSFLSACGGSRGASIPFLPGPAAVLDGSRAHPSAVGSVSSDVVAIDAGDATSHGGFATDQDFNAGSWTNTVSAAIDTSSIASPAPQAVYQSQRLGTTVTYTIPGLAAGAQYTVVLSFAETFFAQAGKRVFNVSINDTTVLSSFDVFASTGKIDKAIAKSFAATASASGTITIGFAAVTNYAIVNAIEIRANSATPTAAPMGGVLIDAGGPASGHFVADEDFTGTNSYSATVPNPIATNGVTDPAPQAVYQSQRVGTTVTYTIPQLVAGAQYAVRLDFSENFFTSKGKRIFDVSINGTTVLSKLDIYASAGGAFTALAKSFTTNANQSGQVVITLDSSVNNAAIDGVEVTPTGSTSSPHPTTFNDYPTFGYDNARDSFNPNSKAISPASLAKLHLAWQTAVGDFNTQTQPILGTAISGHAGMLFVGGGSGRMYGYDALTGGLVWKSFLGQETYRSAACGSNVNYFGIGGTAAYDPASKSLYVVDNQNATLNAYSHNGLFHVDAATGNVLGHVDFTPTAAGPGEINFGHTAVTLNNGIAYAGTGTTCDIPSWRGRVVAVNVPAMTVAATFFTTWDPSNSRGQGAQPWGGGGIWGWGGVALDPNGNVLTGVGNAESGLSGPVSPPFTPAPHEYSGYAESLLELSPNLSHVLADQHPVPVGSYNTVSNDLDVQGTPLVVSPAGCGTMVALQGKAGELTIYDESRIDAGFAAQYQLSPSTFADGYLGDPAYSPLTGLIYAPVASSVSPTLFSPGLIAIDPGCGHPSVTWRAAFGSDSSAIGIPRSVPAASAGGVVFAGSVGKGGTGGDLWAVDASTGVVLNGGNPILQTSGYLRTPAVIDGDWLFVIDDSGNLYGLTIDSNYAAIPAQSRAPDARQRRTWIGRRANG
jgi:hypothetical protein